VEENPFYTVAKSKFVEENPFYMVVKSKFVEENPFCKTVKPNSVEGILKNGFLVVPLLGESIIKKK
jgi:hypothetical protein